MSIINFDTYLKHLIFLYVDIELERLVVLSLTLLLKVQIHALNWHNRNKNNLPSPEQYPSFYRLH